MLQNVPFAGSAIVQNTRLKNFDEWRPKTDKNLKPKWLLLSGASDPPCKDISTRHKRDGAFLHGPSQDIGAMEKIVYGKVKSDEWELSNRVMDFKLTKASARDKMKELFSSCKKNGWKPVIYYTGHGQTGTGNWCFNAGDGNDGDGTLSIEEIEEDVRTYGCAYPLIISDACFSGRWANYCTHWCYINCW